MTEQESIQLHIAENIHRIEVIEDFLRTNSDANDKECRKNIDILTKTNKALEEVQQYRAIGTPEECRAAVEKQKAKKPIIKYKQTQDCVTEVEWKCPICGTNYVELAPCGEWCRYCGTKFDWSDEE